MRPEFQHWCVVRSAPRQEQRAETNLLRQGYNAFYPHIFKQVRHARRVSRKAAPLFPGYLFVSIDPSRTAWSPIQSTYGVSGLVRFGERPALLPPGLVERLRALSGPNGITAGQGAGPGPVLSLGDTVRVSGGVFDDWIGEVVGLPDLERVSLLLKAASRSIEVTLPANAAHLIPVKPGDGK